MFSAIDYLSDSKGDEFVISKELEVLLRIEKKLDMVIELLKNGTVRWRN